MVQRWVAPFDLGVARAANDDLTGAESAFRTALRLDPARCETRFNLAATIEAIGDDIQGGALNPVARQRYEDALTVAEAGTCDPETEPGHRLAQLIDRLRQKLSRAAAATTRRRRPPTDSRRIGSRRPTPASSRRATSRARSSNGTWPARPSGATVGDDHAGTGNRDRTRW